MSREYQSAEIKDLVADLIKAQGEIKHANKDAENPAYKKDGKASTYADLVAVIDAAKPHLLKNHLVISQTTDFVDGVALLITTLMHKSGQWIRGYYPLKPAKENDPQSLAGASTYARRTAYAAIVGNASIGEDDDGNLASGVTAEKTISAAEKKRKYDEVKQAIEASDAPGVTWQEKLADINKLLIWDRGWYDELVKIGAKRRSELEALAATKALDKKLDSAIADDPDAPPILRNKKA